MAGIGFALKKLMKRGDLGSLIQASLHSAFVAAGPWIISVLGLTVVQFFLVQFLSLHIINSFRIILIYNFCFSLILSSPFFMILTRFVADEIYLDKTQNILGALLGTLFLIFITSTPLVIFFYGYLTKISSTMAFSAYINYMLLANLWALLVFVTALQNYYFVSFAFLLGMSVGVVSTIYISYLENPAYLLGGISLGFAVINAILLYRIFIEYPLKLKKPFAFLNLFKKHWDLALGGLFYNIAIWIDNWVMWFTPNATKLKNGLIYYPDYDNALFLAYLFVIPAMARFIITTETEFYHRYKAFYDHIQNNLRYQYLKKDHENIYQSLLSEGFHLFIFQLVIVSLAIFLAPKFFEYFRINYLQLNIFRLSVLGGLFHVFVLFFAIILSYLGDYRRAFFIYLFFAVSNAIFTKLSVYFGFAYYGFGYLAASVLTFGLAAILTDNYVYKLPYHAFVTANESIEK